MSKKLKSKKDLENTKNTVEKKEFFNRYDKLIKLLNPFEKEPNLILYTKSENMPFKVFKNSNNQISVVAGEEKAKLSFTKDRLASIVYDGKDIDYHKSYTEVLIEKLLNNSIFDDIKTDLDFSFMPESKIRKLEEENDKLTGQIQKLNEKIEKRERDYNKLNEIIENVSTAEQDFLNAKETALKEIKLQEAYKYWEDEVTVYSNKYRNYLITSIVTSIILLIFVFTFLDKNPLIIEYTNNNDINIHLKKDTDSKIEKNDNIKVENIQLWKYGFLILLTTMVIWLIRILIKITLSNYHLSVDAKERVVMIRTYLSLLKEGESFEKEDKKVMLDNIFRPTNFGIISDETSVTLTDVISSLKK
jgi:hypothetical protein